MSVNVKNASSRFKLIDNWLSENVILDLGFSLNLNSMLIFHIHFNVCYYEKIHYSLK